MKHLIMSLLLLTGVAAKAQGVPAEIQLAFDASNVQIEYQNNGWYSYDVWDESTRMVLYQELLETCQEWNTAPPIWEGVIAAREFAYDNWVVVLFKMQNENGDYGIVGSIIRKGEVLM